MTAVHDNVAIETIMTTRAMRRFSHQPVADAELVAKGSFTFKVTRVG